MRFKQILRGARATARVLVPFEGRAELVPVLVRVLTADERATAVARGREYAQKNGIKDPVDGDEVFGIGVQANTIALSCMDADAPEAAFFETVEEVLSMDPETIVFLYTHWQVHQDAHAPQRLNLTPEEFFTKVIALAEAETPDPFVSMRPGLQWICMRSMARQLVSFWTAKSPSISFSEVSTSSNTSPEPDAVASALAAAPLEGPRAPADAAETASS